MGLAALAIMEAFMLSAPDTPEGQLSKRYIAEASFHSWRALPYDFPVSVRERFCTIAKSTSNKHLRETGGRFFQVVSKLIGPFTAGAMLRLIRGKPYKAVQSISQLELKKLIDM
jgi:hypothetical protein